MAWTCESPSSASDAEIPRIGGLRRVVRSASGRILLLAFSAVALTLSPTGAGLAGWAVGGLGQQSAFAVTTSSVKAQIASLQAQFATAGAAVHQATVVYQRAVSTEQALAGQLSADRSRAAQAASSLVASETALRNELVGAYVGGYFVSPAAPVSLNGVGAADPAVSEGYISVATDTVRGIINRYQTDRVEWTDAVTTVAASEKQSQEAVSAAATARAAALDEATSVARQIAGLQSQLASLVAQAGAQQAPALEGGPVPGGLVAAVKAQIGVTSAAVTSSVPAPQGSSTGTGSASAGPSASTAPRTSVPSPPLVVPVVSSPPATTPPATAAPSTTAPPATPASSAPSTSVATATSASSGAPTPADWLKLRTCESSDTYTEDTGNGYYGAYQFSQATWTGLGYPGRPDQEPPAMQDQAAAQLQAEAGWGAWPACSAALGL